MRVRGEKVRGGECWGGWWVTDEGRVRGEMKGLGMKRVRERGNERNGSEGSLVGEYVRGESWSGLRGGDVRDEGKLS